MSDDSAFTAILVIVSTLGLILVWYMIFSQPSAPTPAVTQPPQDIIIMSATSYVKQGMTVTMYGKQYGADHELAGHTTFDLNGTVVVDIAPNGKMSFYKPECKDICIAPAIWWDFFEALKAWNEKIRSDQTDLQSE